MKELLNEEQQKGVIQRLNDIVKDYYAQKRSVYVVLEPNLDEAIKDIFFQSNVRYKEPFMLFDTRFEDVGPRIARLGDNQKFDDWITDTAFFNKWTALFVSTLDIQEFSMQISRLCNAITVENKPVIFRSYTPTVLNEWLPVLQDENQVKEAVGFCSEILCLTDFPDKLNRYYFDERDNFIQTEIDLLAEHQKFVLQTALSELSYSNRNWHISEKQHHSLIIARVNYLIHRIRARLLLNQNIRNRYSPVELHQKLIELVNMCFKYQIMDESKVETVINLYFGYTEQWDSNYNRITAILSSPYSSEEKIDRIAILLQNHKAG